MAEPRALVEAVEAHPHLPHGTGERFAGWGVFGLPFATGHILALRRYPASSIGPGFTAIWHRDPGERWTFYADVEPVIACPRYFGSAIAETVVTPIAVTWTEPHRFTVATGDGAVRWRVTLASTATTWALNAVSGVIPDPLWRQPRLLALIGGLSGPALRAGRVGLHGRVPNGQAFAACPRLIWAIPDSTATVRGIDLGPVGALPEQARLGDFWLPQTGLFAIGQLFMEGFDAGRHRAVTHGAR
jgi:hypothetical protein